VCPYFCIKLDRHLDHRGIRLYLCDNAGEIAFDKHLVSSIQTLGPKVTVAFRGGPIMNDATIEDACDVGMSALVKTVTTGTPVCGTLLIH